LVVFNGVASEFSLLSEKGNLRLPWDVDCISETTCLVTNERTANIAAWNLRGESKGVLVEMESPKDMLYIKNLDLLAISNDDGAREGNVAGKIYIFNITDHEERLSLEQPLNHVSPHPPTAGISLGEPTT
jgi:hypothetical protein